MGENVTNNAGAVWIPPDDFGQIIECAYRDYIDIECDGVKDLTALRWSACCMYIGKRLRPLSPFKRSIYKKASLWINAPGAGDFLGACLTSFLFACLNADKIPYIRDFWAFSGFDVLEFPAWYEVKEGVSPDYVFTVVKTVKEAEKHGIESILTDRKTNTQGALTLLQIRHGYDLKGITQDSLQVVITADALPVIGQIAQKENDS